MTMTLEELVQFPCGFFRREKAEQCPDDTRNLTAAGLLDEIGAELPFFEGGPLHRTIDSLVERYGEEHGIRFSEIVGEVQRDVGFRNDVEDCNGFLETVIDRLTKEAP